MVSTYTVPRERFPSSIEEKREISMFVTIDWRGVESREPRRPNTALLHSNECWKRVTERFANECNLLGEKGVKTVSLCSKVNEYKVDTAVVVVVVAIRSPENQTTLNGLEAKAPVRH